MKRGIALILVVGVLGVLAVLGSAFAVLTRLERRAAATRVQATQAFLLARSGLEDAQARLDLGQDPAYEGEDWDGDGSLNGFEAASEVYRPGVLDLEACPARHALRPTFFVTSATDLGADLKPAPRRIRVEGRERGYSGALTRGSWSLKVTRPGGFFVNGGDPAVPLTATTDYNVILRRMLGTLAEALDRETGGDDGAPVDQVDGQNLISLRPPTGWQSFTQIRDGALGGSQAKLDALEPYLTLTAWTDKKVISPNLKSLGGGYSTWGYVKYDRKLVGTTRAPDLERINGRVVGRAPVDLAWARTKRPALIALLANLRGVYVNEYAATFTRIGVSGPVQLLLDWTQASDDCRTAADALLASTSDLRTWEQWDDFCDGLPMTGTSDQPQAKRDVLKANFNPNARLNVFNPDLSQARFVDKSGLWVYSTELNLSDRGNVRITSAGRVQGGRDGALASRTLTVQSRPASLFRLSAQSEFVGESLGNPDEVGDEGGWRALGSTPYITDSAGVSRTFGHALLGNAGKSLQTWPEPHPVWTAPGTGTPALYDGRVQSATLETEIDAGGPGGSMLFLARWDQGYGATYSKNGGSLSCQPISPDPGNVVPSKNLPAATVPLWDTPRLGQLYPDGVYSETYRVPGYAIQNNAPGFHGAISFWLKPSYDATKIPFGATGASRRSHLFFNNNRRHGSTATSTAAFLIGEASGRNYALINTCAGPFFLWDSDFETNDDSQDEYIAAPSVDRPLRSHRWQLLSVLYDTDSALMSLGSARWLLDRGTRPEDENGTDPKYGSGVGTVTGFDFSALVNGTPPQPTGVSSFYLGYGGGNAPAIPGGATPQIWMNNCDVTFDEFAIYDLGSVASGASLLLDFLAQSRFSEGRFYKESDYPASGGLLQAPGAFRNAGEWFSAPVDLGDARLRSLSWTQIVPPGLKNLSPVPAGTPIEDYDDGPEGRVALELANASVQVPYTVGAAYAVDTRGREIDTFFTDPRGALPIGRRLKEPFRLHAVFQPNLDAATKQDKAVVDPLSLDDVTVVYRPMDQPGYSSWSEGE